MNAKPALDHSEPEIAEPANTDPAPDTNGEPTAEISPPKKRIAYTDSEADLGFDNPMLEKIRKLLVSTDPDRWNIGGEDLSNEARFARPRSMYEQVLVRDIPNGSLVLHCAQPVSSVYVPGGYALTALGPPAYTIEVRDRIFDPEKVVDPKYSGNQKGKRCDIVASGDIAKSLFLQVRATIREFYKQTKKEFDERVMTLSDTICDFVEKTPITSWQKKNTVEKEEQTIRYTLENEGLTIEIQKFTKDWNSTYKVIFCFKKHRHDKTSMSIAKVCFLKLEELEQNAQLEALADRLKEIGIE